MAARELHSQAEQQREKGNFTEALISTDQALVAYLAESDTAGFAEVIASRFLTLRHLYEATENRAYLILAKHEARAAVELSELSEDKSAKIMPLFNLAKAEESLGEHAVAVTTFRQAVKLMETHPPARHSRPAVLADMKVHLGISELKNGDKAALGRVNAAIDDLKASEEMQYNKDVWVSGAYLKLAEALAESEPEKARENLAAAKEIIDGNPELSIRAKQWQKLAGKIN